MADNFGDNLIRICFEAILRIVLSNLAVNDYNIKVMHLKSIDEKLVASSDIIFFAGGGLFGFSYLNLFDYTEKIVEIADKKKIPVIFSSMGINNMDATPESEKRIEKLLNKSCVRAFSGRENIDFFKKYVHSNTQYVPQLVADPAVWVRDIYSRYLTTSRDKIVGINVVRGGLFKDNGNVWNIDEEMAYLNGLKELLDKAHIKYRFYTNGSVLDNNALRYFAKTYQISEESLIFPHSTREFIETVGKFKAVIAIRMHSAIVSYSLGIPSICLVWNEKIPHFYQNIGYEDRALPLSQWTCENVYESLQKLLNDKKYHTNEKYLMTTYEYLFHAVSKVIDKKVEMFSQEEIAKRLQEQGVSPQEDLINYRLKCDRSEYHYVACFEQNRELKTQNKKLKEKNSELEKQLKKINSMFIVRCYRKIFK